MQVSISYLHTYISQLKLTIAQQEQALAELSDYIAKSTGQHQQDALCADATWRYLESCHHMFERGIMNKNISLHIPDGSIVKQMEKGQEFFTSWLNALLSTGYEPTPATQKSFISWQVHTYVCTNG